MMIGKEKAFEIFLSGSKKAKLTVTRIEKWDPEKTLKENAAEVGFDYQSAVQLASKYELPHR